MKRRRKDDDRAGLLLLLLGAGVVFSMLGRRRRTVNTPEASTFAYGASAASASPSAGASLRTQPASSNPAALLFSPRPRPCSEEDRRRGACDTNEVTQTSSPAAAVAAAIARVGSGSPGASLAASVAQAAFEAVAGRSGGSTALGRVRLVGTRNRPSQTFRVETLTPDLVTAVVSAPVGNAQATSTTNTAGGSTDYLSSL